MRGLNGISRKTIKSNVRNVSGIGSYLHKVIKSRTYLSRTAFYAPTLSQQGGYRRPMPRRTLERPTKRWTVRLPRPRVRPKPRGSARRRSSRSFSRAPHSGQPSTVLSEGPVEQ